MAKKTTNQQLANNPALAVRRVVGLSPSLVGDVRTLIEQTRERTAAAVNSELVWLYWQVGARIRQDILKEQRAEYGKQIVHALSGQLVAEYGNGFSEKTLRHAVRFAEVLPDEKIVSTLRRQLGWSHICKSDEHVELLRLDESGIRVAEYLTELPPRKLLECKLHQAIKAARHRLGTLAK